MALFGGSALRDLNESLSGLHASDNKAYGTPAQAKRTAGLESLDDRLNKVAAHARKLVEKGRSAEACAALDNWRGEPIRPQVIGTNPSLHAELPLMTQMVDDIVAGRTVLDASLAQGSEVEQVRYYGVKNAVERQQRWTQIMDDIQSRAGL